MLVTRVLTAAALLAVVLPVLWLDSFFAFAALTAVFFGLAAWESFRLFKAKRPRVAAALLTGFLFFLILQGKTDQANLLYAVCVAIWAIRLAPALGIGLPPLDSPANRLLSGVYGIALLGCFLAIAGLYDRSPAFLVSAMAIVWVADVGAYFAGRTFGRRRLAPSISPGKTWEGAVGGWVLASVAAAATATQPALAQSFPARLLAGWGWGGLTLSITAIVAASVVGDLFESQLKRRAGMKDSSRLLPGHGGILDRVDALVPALPLAALLASRF